MSKTRFILFMIILACSLNSHAESTSYDNRLLETKVNVISDSLRALPKLMMKEVDYDYGRLKIPAYWMIFWEGDSRPYYCEERISSWYYGESSTTWARIDCFSTPCSDYTLENVSEILHHAKLINASTGIVFNPSTNQWEATERIQLHTAATDTVPVLIREIYIRKSIVLQVLTIQHTQLQDSIVQPIINSWQTDYVIRSHWPDVDDLPMRLYD